MEKIQATHLFQYLQQFLKAKEYRNLMNTNYEKFHIVKKETVIFNVRADNTMNFKESEPLSEDKRRFLLYFFDNVNNARKQINFSITTRRVEDIINFHPHFANLSKVSIETYSTIFPSDFDFNIFNNIEKVSLSGFKGISRISNGLQNIQDLFIHMEDLIEIYDFSRSKSLKRLEFSYCNNLFHESFLEQTEENDLFYLVTWSSIPCFEVVFTSKEDSFIDLRRLFARHVTNLKINIRYVKFNARMAEPLMDIPDLNLYDASYDYPDFLKFTGHKLSLHAINISNWTNGAVNFPHLEVLWLGKCKPAKELLTIPTLKNLTLYEIRTMEIIPTLPLLIRLDIIGVEDLKEIRYQPKLKQLYFSPFDPNETKIDPRNEKVFTRDIF
jgi:hypothetical protein